MYYLANGDTAPIIVEFEGVVINCPCVNNLHMVPVKSVCKAIGVDFATQDKFIKEHSLHSQYYERTLIESSDKGKIVEMCLSIVDIGGWLFNIDQGDRSETEMKKQYELSFIFRGRWIKRYTPGFRLSSPPTITRINFNDKEIICYDTDSGYLVPIKTICEILGVSYEAQLTYLRENTIAQGGLIPIIGEASYYLHIRYIIGWIMNIDYPGLSDRATAIYNEVKMDLHDVLYDKFHMIP